MSRILIVTAAVLALAAPAMAQEDASTETRLYDVAALRPSMVSNLDTENDRDFVPLGIPAARHRPQPHEWLEEADQKFTHLQSHFIEIASSALPPEDQDEARLEPLAKSSLVAVRTSTRGHEVVRAVLDALRASRSRGLTIEIVSLTIPAESVDGGAVAGLNGTVADTERLKWLTSLDVHRGRRRSTLDTEVGTWSVARETRNIGYLAEYDVEIAQAASIGDPHLLTAQDGMRAAVRAFPLRDGRHLLRVVASTGDLSTNRRLLDLATTDLGQVELPEYRGGIAAFETVARVGETRMVVLGSADGSKSALWRVLLLTPQRARLSSPLDLFRIYHLGSLSAADHMRRLHWEEIEDFSVDPHVLLGPSSKEPTTRVHFDSLVNLVMEAAGEELERQGTYLAPLRDAPTDGGRVIVRTSSEGFGRIEGALARYEKTVLRQVGVQIQLQSSGGDLGTETIAQLSAPVIVGRDAALAAYRGVSFVAEYDVEVAQESRIADPVIRTARSGAFANVRVDPDTEGRFALQLDLRVSASSPPVQMQPETAEVGVVERVIGAVRGRTIRLSLSPGKEHTVALGTDPFDRSEKRTLRAVIRLDSE